MTKLEKRKIDLNAMLEIIDSLQMYRNITNRIEILSSGETCN